MKRKIFISVNLSDRDKKRLVRPIEKWPDLPVKWTKKLNFHLTLAFLGHVDDSMLAEIGEKVRVVVENKDSFDIEFERIEIGPSDEEQRLVWLTGEASEDLRALQEDIEKALGLFVASKKVFRPHITLGKIRKHKWDALAEKPNIEENFPLTVAVESVEVMASDFVGDGMEYTVIESCPLK